MELEFCKRRRKETVDFAKWFVTDYMWPSDGERRTTTERNKATLTALGANVVEGSVDVMNVGEGLAQGIESGTPVTRTVKFGTVEIKFSLLTYCFVRPIQNNGETIVPLTSLAPQYPSKTGAC
eukprot:4904530-Pyramimonas_sp.AAC.1